MPHQRKNVADRDQTTPMHWVWFALAVLVAAAVSVNAMAADVVPRQDKLWLQNTYQICLAAIKASKVALRQGESPVVDTIASNIIADDRMLKAKLTKTAHALNVPLPNAPSTVMQSKLDGVTAKSGKAFDRAWVALMLDTELKAARKTQEEIADGNSQRVRTLARHTLPVIGVEIDALQVAMHKLNSAG